MQNTHKQLWHLGETRKTTEEHQKQLNAAHDEWQSALRQAQGKAPGRPTQASGLAPAGGPESAKKGFRIQSLGVLLTYQKFSDFIVWPRFVAFAPA